MWEFLLSFLVELLVAALLALGGVWWAWGRKWLQRRKERKGREFRAKVERCVREGGREMGAEDALRNREVETLPPSPDKIWRVRGYLGGNILEEEWYADIEEAKRAGRRFLQWYDYPDPDGRPPFDQIKVVNVKTGEVALSLASRWA